MAVVWPPPSRHRADVTRLGLGARCWAGLGWAGGWDALGRDCVADRWHGATPRPPPASTTIYTFQHLLSIFFKFHLHETLEK